MSSILEQLFLPYISQLGMNKTEIEKYRNIGNTFKCDTEVGNGFCWVYSLDNRFSLSVYDFEIQESVTAKYDHPEFFTIGKYNVPAVKYIYENPKVDQSIISYNMPEGTFSETFSIGTRVKSCGLTLSPDFVKSLSKRFCIDYRFLAEDCLNIENNLVISNADFVMKQIFSYKPSNYSAAMYYEGKIMELLTMLVEWQVNNEKFAPYSIKEMDLEGLNEVTDYLKKNYQKDISIEDLMRVAFMGRNKLSHLFKLKYGISIMEYLRIIRIEQAKQILLNSTLPIHQVANMVGYKNQGSFSERFKETTGISPKEFRNNFIGNNELENYNNLLK